MANGESPRQRACASNLLRICAGDLYGLREVCVWSTPYACICIAHGLAATNDDEDDDIVSFAGCTDAERMFYICLAFKV